MVYIPGAADIRNENTNQTEAIALSKEDKILEYSGRMEVFLLKKLLI